MGVLVLNWCEESIKGSGSTQWKGVLSESDIRGQRKYRNSWCPELITCLLEYSLSCAGYSVQIQKWDWVTVSICLWAGTHPVWVWGSRAIHGRWESLASPATVESGGAQTGHLSTEAAFHQSILMTTFGSGSFIPRAILFLSSFLSSFFWSTILEQF